VLDAGARAVAVCTAVIGAPDIAAEAAWFKARLAERRPPA
jgi:thiamine monophosphate synthase